MIVKLDGIVVSEGMVGWAGDFTEFTGDGEIFPAVGPVHHVVLEASLN